MASRARTTGDNDRTGRLLSQPVALLTIRDLEAFCRRVLDRRLSKFNARFRPDVYDEALAFLFATAVELAARYDDSKNTSFSKYLWNVLGLRVVDFMRKELGDTRAGARPVVLSLDAHATSGDTDGDDPGERNLGSALPDRTTDGELDRVADRIGLFAG
jgi:hypothetical protein